MSEKEKKKLDFHIETKIDTRDFLVNNQKKLGHNSIGYDRAYSKVDQLGNKRRVKYRRKKSFFSANKDENEVDQDQKKDVFYGQDKLSLLEVFEERDKVDKDNEEFIPLEDFKGPVQERTYTDKKYIYLLVVLLMFYTGYGIYLIIQGDTHRLVYGTDFRAEVCGQGKLQSKQFLYYINPLKDHQLAMCIEKCTVDTGRDICLYKKDIVNIWNSVCEVGLQSYRVGKHCIPVEPRNRAIVLEQLGLYFQIVQFYAHDVQVMEQIIYLCILIVLPVSFIFLVLLFIKVSVVVFLSEILLLCQLGILSFLEFQHYERNRDWDCRYNKDYNTCITNKTYMVLYASIFFFCLGIIKFILFLSRFKWMIRGIIILEGAIETNKTIKQLVLVPIFNLFFGFILIVSGFLIVSHALSIGDIIVVDSVLIYGGKLRKIQYNVYYLTAISIIFLILLRILLLVVQGISDLIISYSICIWYFTKKKDSVSLPIKLVIKNIMKYHLGSVLKFSLIQTFDIGFRVIMEPFRMFLRRFNQLNPRVRFVISSCQLCLNSYENVLRYINKKAYIQLAMLSEPIYKCEKKAYFLQFRHKDVVRDFDVIQQNLLDNMRMNVNLFAFIVFYCIMVYSKRYIDNLNNYLVVWLITYFFINIFSGFIFNTFDMISKTVLQCYLMDNEMFTGEQMYAEKFIHDYIQRYCQITKNQVLSKQKDHQQFNTEQIEYSEDYDSEDDIDIGKMQKDEKINNSNPDEQLPKELKNINKVNVGPNVGLNDTGNNNTTIINDFQSSANGFMQQPDLNITNQVETTQYEHQQENIKFHRKQTIGQDYYDENEEYQDQQYQYPQQQQQQGQQFMQNYYESDDQQSKSNDQDYYQGHNLQYQQSYNNNNNPVQTYRNDDQYYQDEYDDQDQDYPNGSKRNPNRNRNGHKTDRNDYNPDRNDYYSNRNGYNPDRNGQNTDRNGQNTDRNGYNPDRNGYNPDRNGYNPDGDNRKTDKKKKKKKNNQSQRNDEQQYQNYDQNYGSNDQTQRNNEVSYSNINQTYRNDEISYVQNDQSQRNNDMSYNDRNIFDGNKIQSENKNTGRKRNRKAIKVQDDIRRQDSFNIFSQALNN